MDTSKGIADVPEWFKGSRLNYAENLLQHKENDRVALYAARESQELLGFPLIVYFLFCFNFLAIPEILVPGLGIEPWPSVLEAWSSNHWAAREVPFLKHLESDISDI